MSQAGGHRIEPTGGSDKVFSSDFVPNMETIEATTEGQKQVSSVIYTRLLPTADQAEALQLRFYAEDKVPGIAGASLGGVLRGLGRRLTFSVHSTEIVFVSGM